MALVERISDTINRLVVVVQDANNATSELSRRLVFLNWALVVFTAILVLLGILTLVRL